MTRTPTINGAGDTCFWIGLGRRNACGDSSAGLDASQAPGRERVDKAGSYPNQTGLTERPSNHTRGKPAGGVAASAVASHGLLKREATVKSTPNVG